MRIGAHVQTGGDLLRGLARARAAGAEVVQLFVQNPRGWRPTSSAPGALAAFREARAQDPVVAAAYCHAPYLVNLATGDAALLERSRASLVANLATATGLGASGLVLHLGSHLGAGLDARLAQIVDALLRVLEEAPAAAALAYGREAACAPCPLLLENTAGAGGAVGAGFEELARVLERADAGAALGVCLDTQHLWASGEAFASRDGAAAVVAALARTVGPGALRLVHANDSKVPLGARVDRHANWGEGTIGASGLGWLLGHPALEGVDALLETPGAGEGPRASDLVAARRAVAAGRRRWTVGADAGRGPPPPGARHNGAARAARRAAARPAHAAR